LHTYQQLLAGAGFEFVKFGTFVLVDRATWPA
jgi:hypothetical protein